jgi:hypothetical protein
MKILNKSLLSIFLVILSISALKSQKSYDDCSELDPVYKEGEKLKYIMTYNWFLVWTDVGEATFEVRKENKFGQEVYHFIGKGKSYPFYDWFYEVRDIYESWIDTETYRPIFYKRDVNEGGYHIDITYDYNWTDTVAYANSKKTRKPLKVDTIKLPSCTYDVVSLIYHARTIDFSEYDVGEKIPLNLLLDSQIENIYIRYQGKEQKRVRGLGKFNCIKFTGYLVKGDVFKGGEELEVWVTDDKNRIPVWIESPIKVGKIKARLSKYKNLKYDMEAKIK